MFHLWAKLLMRVLQIRQSNRTKVFLFFFFFFIAWLFRIARVSFCVVYLLYVKIYEREMQYYLYLIGILDIIELCAEILKKWLYKKCKHEDTMIAIR